MNGSPQSLQNPAMGVGSAGMQMMQSGGPSSTPQPVNFGGLINLAAQQKQSPQMNPQMMGLLMQAMGKQGLMGTGAPGGPPSGLGGSKGGMSSPTNAAPWGGAAQGLR